MSTLGIPADNIDLLIRRPDQSAAVADIPRAISDDERTKRLTIPVLIDSYNSYINSVYVMDHIRF